MGRTILCNHCKSTFDEDVLSKRENPNICPVCDESLISHVDNTVQTDTAHTKVEKLSFGDDVMLWEYDSFDEEKIDFWWYEMREPGELDEYDAGDVGTTCTKCGTFSMAPYPIARCKDYILIDPRYTDTCSKCGNEMRNHILSKRPANFVDTRRRDTFITYDNIPRCPICQSSQIHKISATNKVASAITFGIFASGHVSKTYKCDNCGAKF